MTAHAASIRAALDLLHALERRIPGRIRACAAVRRDGRRLRCRVLDAAACAALTPEPDPRCTTHGEAP